MQAALPELLATSSRECERLGKWRRRFSRITALRQADSAAMRSPKRGNRSLAGSLIEAEGWNALSRDDLWKIVRPWGPLKQRTATSASSLDLGWK
jgi:hypothetical protein